MTRLAGGASSIPTTIFRSSWVLALQLNESQRPILTMQITIVLLLVVSVVFRAAGILADAAHPSTANPQLPLLVMVYGRI
jgi:hypothetical protein